MFLFPWKRQNILARFKYKSSSNCIDAPKAMHRSVFCNMDAENVITGLFQAETY